MANKQQQKNSPQAKVKNPNKIVQLTLDDKNANKHSQYGTGLLENSVREAGFGRSILISNDNVVIAGNGTVEAAAAIGMENVQVVETDGTKIIAVKRTDIQSGTAAFHRMALADNIVASKNIVMDAEAVEVLVEEYGIGEDNVKFWANIVLEPVDPERLADPDKANVVQASFQLSSAQAGALNKAIKISKQLNKTKFEKQDNTNSNGNALFFIVDHYLKANGHIKVDEGEGKGQKPQQKASPKKSKK